MRVLVFPMQIILVDIGSVERKNIKLSADCLYQIWSN